MPVACFQSEGMSSSIRITNMRTTPANGKTNRSTILAWPFISFFRWRQRIEVPIHAGTDPRQLQRATPAGAILRGTTICRTFCKSTKNEQAAGNGKNNSGHAITKGVRHALQNTLVKNSCHSPDIRCTFLSLGSGSRLASPNRETRRDTDRVSAAGGQLEQFY